mmetsp:Transcript_13773/g.21995  ORF Transcript_13773/g.21995 Transcript_13773/m.21995 type:complete len:312 (+) Transcript_13773:282-1217(+)
MCAIKAALRRLVGARFYLAPSCVSCLMHGYLSPHTAPNMGMAATAKSAARRPISSRFRPAPFPDVPVHEEEVTLSSPFFSLFPPELFLSACSSLLDMSLMSRKGMPKLAHTLPIAAASISSQSVPNSCCTASMELFDCSQMSAEATFPLKTLGALLLFGHEGNFIVSAIRWAALTKGGCDDMERAFFAPTMVWKPLKSKLPSCFTRNAPAGTTLVPMMTSPTSSFFACAPEHPTFTTPRTIDAPSSRIAAVSTLAALISPISVNMRSTVCPPILPRLRLRQPPSGMSFTSFICFLMCPASSSTAHATMNRR